MECYKIIIRGGYGLSNFGDDALMIEVYNQLINEGFTNSDIAFNCDKASYLNLLIPNINVIDIHNKDFKCQYFIYGGGTQFYSFDKAKIEIKRIFKYLVKRILSWIRKPKWDKSYALGIGLGPFKDKLSIKEMDTKLLFKNIDKVWPRDVKSFELCKKWKLKNYATGTDICNISDVKSELVSSSKNPKTALVLRDWKKGEVDSYYNSIVKLIEAFSIRNYDFSLILFSTKKDQYWLEKFKDLGYSYEIWNPKAKSDYHDFIDLLSSFNLLITSRYHGAIYATNLNIPFITIGVEQKLEMISKLYNKGSFCWKDPYDINECMSFIDIILSDNENYSQHIKQKRKEEKRKAETMFNQLMEEIK